MASLSTCDVTHAHLVFLSLSDFFAERSHNQFLSSWTYYVAAISGLHTGNTTLTSKPHLFIRPNWPQNGRLANFSVFFGVGGILKVTPEIETAIGSAER